jgi:hypothetical protein
LLKWVKKYKHTLCAIWYHTTKYFFCVHDHKFFVFQINFLIAQLNCGKLSRMIMKFVGGLRIVGHVKNYAIRKFTKNVIQNLSFIESFGRFFQKQLMKLTAVPNLNSFVLFWGLPISCKKTIFKTLKRSNFFIKS